MRRVTETLTILGSGFGGFALGFFASGGIRIVCNALYTWATGDSQGPQADVAQPQDHNTEFNTAIGGGVAGFIVGINFGLWHTREERNYRTYWAGRADQPHLNR